MPAICCQRNGPKKVLRIPLRTSYCVIQLRGAGTYLNILWTNQVCFKFGVDKFEDKENFQGFTFKSRTFSRLFPKAWCGQVPMSTYFPAHLQLRFGNFRKSDKAISSVLNLYFNEEIFSALHFEYQDFLS